MIQYQSMQKNYTHPCPQKYQLYLEKNQDIVLQEVTQDPDFVDFSKAFVQKTSAVTATADWSSNG